MAYTKYLDRLSKNLICHKYKRPWYEILFFLISEIQTIYIILSIAIHNSYFLSDPSNSNLVQAQPGYDMIFNLKDSPKLDKTSLTVIGLYLAFLLSLLISSAIFLKSILIQILSNSLAIFHRDFLFIVLQQLLLYTYDHKEVNSVGFSTIFLLCINTLLTLTYSRICYAPFEKDYTFSQRSSKLFVTTTFYKIFALLLESYIKSEINQPLRISLAGTYLILIGFNLMQFPFYNLNVIFFVYSFKSIEFSCLLAVILRWAYNGSINFCFFVAVALSIFSIKIAYSLIKRTLERSWQLGTLNVKSINDFENKLLAIDYILKNGAQIASREKFHESLIFYLGQFEKIEGNLNLVEMERFNQIILDRFFEEGASLPFSKSSRFIYLRVVHELRSKNKISVESLVKLAGSTNASVLEDRLLSSKLLENILSTVNTNLLVEKNLRISNVITYYENRISFLNLLKNSTEKYIQFWNNFMVKPKISELFDQSIIINEIANKIHTIWLYLKSKKGNNCKIEAGIYSGYLYLIRCSPFISRLVLIFCSTYFDLF